MIPQLPELADPTAGLVFVALATNLLSVLALGLLARRRLRGTDRERAGPATATTPETGAGTGTGTEADVDTHVETVRCPDCETANERGYRFCRDCLAELPGATRFGGGGSDPFRVAP